MTPEHERLQECRKLGVPWKKWGPYLSERQWGTVREDYSETGDAWSYFPHDLARSRAYHWGEDGLAGFSDDLQRLCFALALWNGKDPTLKERAFGLVNTESNHGEDVKEYYFYLDNTPTHSYMKYLYKYPQTAFPYEDLVKESSKRTRGEFEYELLDTGAFDKNKYFDIFVEYAKASTEDFLIQITIHNRGTEPAELHVLPTLWFRNWWSWNGITEKPVVKFANAYPDMQQLEAQDSILGTWNFYCQGRPTLLFTENETNSKRLYDIPNRTPYVKDAFHSYLIHGQKDAVNPALTGTKFAACYRLLVEPLQSNSIYLRLSKNKMTTFQQDFAEIFTARKKEADAFYKAVVPSSLNPDQALVMRQALAGMLWSKQYYFYDVDKWLEERGADPFKESRKTQPRNEHWHHMFNGDVISMPDKWEYPWYAAWDLAFHVLPLTLVDADFGKSQLKLMLRERYMHPNGQMPAYEWNFSDVNPPVHAWSTIFTYRLEKATKGQGDTEWLKNCFQKLLMNFTWWVNRKDRNGRNVFEGGFLGLDNIGVFDRSAPLPTGGYLEQADGTAWMALYCQNMLEISAELALTDPEYADMALKFCEHFLWIATAMGHLGGGDTGMWDEEDGFYYDVLRTPDGNARRLKVRSMVGLLPLCATTVFDGKLMKMYPEMGDRLIQFLNSRQEIIHRIHDPMKLGQNKSHLASILDEKKLRRVLEKMLDENEFLSPYGIRSMSRYHAEHPFVMEAGGREYQVKYLPAESDSGMFGGNSNWRGPIWMPVNALIIRSLLNYHSYYGNDFKIECPTGSGNWMNLYGIAEEISRRLSRIFLLDRNNRRPVFGGSGKFQEDPHWRDCILFYEYFHGENGAGLGASHQTGWTGVVALLLHLFATFRPEDTKIGKSGYFDKHAELMKSQSPAGA